MISLFSRRKKSSVPKQLRHIKDATDLKGKRVLVRVDFNVPLGDDNKVDSTEAWRIEKAMRTINFLRDAGARIILASHIGRDPENSLRPVVDFLNHEMNLTVGFVPEVTGERALEASERLGEGQIVVLENLRSDKREVKNKKSLAVELAILADVYVNEAFSNSHRKHASMVGVPKILPSYIGFQCADEYENLSQALRPAKPLVVIIGGAKFETKLPLIKSMIPLADTLFVGGALANTFFRAKGYEIGHSQITRLRQAKGLLSNANVMIPTDVIVERNKSAMWAAAHKVQTTDHIVDIGTESIETLGKKIRSAQTVIWNGPLGYYEGGYADGTRKLLEIIAASSVRSIIGGGDTVYLIRKHGMEGQFSFVSTAGGAMLDFLADGTLPALEVLS